MVQLEPRSVPRVKRKEQNDKWNIDKKVEVGLGLVGGSGPHCHTHGRESRLEKQNIPLNCTCDGAARPGPQGSTHCGIWDTAGAFGPKRSVAYVLCLIATKPALDTQ